MKRNTSIICLLFVLLFIPSKISAACTESKISEIYSLASDVTYNYTYRETENNVNFDVTFTNLKGRLSIKKTGEKKYHTSGSEITIKNLKPNTEYKFEIYSKNLSCTSDALRTVYVRIPGYNKYYKNPLCNGISEFKYCKKWINTSISYENFQKKVQEYRNSLNEKINKETEEKNIFDKLIEIYTKYYYILLSTLIILCFVMIFRNHKKNELK